jgi:hypothetical protein
MQMMENATNNSRKIVKRGESISLRPRENPLQSEEKIFGYPARESPCNDSI